MSMSPNYQHYKRLQEFWRSANSIRTFLFFFRAEIFPLHSRHEKREIANLPFFHLFDNDVGP